LNPSRNNLETIFGGLI